MVVGPLPNAVSATDDLVVDPVQMALWMRQYGVSPTHWVNVAATTTAGTGLYNVMEFGAAGDGVTDDTASIQTAVNAACAAGGGTVVFPATTFITSAPITLCSGITLDGTGLISYTGSASLQGAFYTPGSGTSLNVYNRIRIRNLSFNFHGSPAIFINGCTDLLIEDVTVTGTAGYTAEAIVAQYCDRLSVRRCVVHDVPGDGICIWACTHFDVSGNQLYNCADDAIDIDTNNASTSTTGSVGGTVTGNVADTIGNGCGIRVENSSRVSVVGNTVNNAGGNGAGIEVNTSSAAGPANVADVTIAGNTVSNCISMGICVDATGGNSLSGVTISGNTVDNCATSSGGSVYGGIALKGPALVDANQVNGGGLASQSIDAAGILVYNPVANGAVITGNRVQGNQAYGIVLWDGANTFTYSGIVIRDNVLAGNNLGNINLPGTASHIGTGTVVQRNAGYNPLGTVTVAVPGSGTATATAPYDRTFYVLTASAATAAISGGPSGIPLNPGTSIFLAAGQTLTPTYTTLTWAVEGQ